MGQGQADADGAIGANGVPAQLQGYNGRVAEQQLSHEACPDGTDVVLTQHQLLKCHVLLQGSTDVARPLRAQAVSIKVQVPEEAVSKKSSAKLQKRRTAQAHISASTVQICNFPRYREEKHKLLAGLRWQLAETHSDRAMQMLGQQGHHGLPAALRKGLLHRLNRAVFLTPSAQDLPTSQIFLKSWVRKTVDSDLPASEGTDLRTGKQAEAITGGGWLEYGVPNLQ
mmetsp:Transcript_117017/g.261694  ORF Transcript_117017/g.261694 Transcript_117017/m.261694 type:complete len:226 (-) Transcript_117017:375-1052(-)